MCGIVGYAGPNDCTEFMLKGLRILEYRGYDSAGIATIDSSMDNFLEVRKEVGVLAHLEESLSHGPIHGKVGIGHTRWATHGRPTQENAHPHCSSDGNICVVHNGIIENHGALRKELKGLGFDFKSDTDSEVIPQLVQLYFNQGMTMREAFFKTLTRLEGAFAVVLIAKNTPNTIYATRRGSPLIAGVGQNEIYLGSDCYPLFEYTQDMIYLEENDALIFEEGKLELFNSSFQEKEIKVTRADKVFLHEGMGGYESYTHKEIHEQPEVVERIINSRLPNDDKVILFDELDIDHDLFQSIDRIYITGCGTAYHAAYLGKYFLEEFVDLPVEAILSSEFRYAKPKLNEKNLVISISQSGETADTLASIIDAKKYGSKILSFVNVYNSSIARESDAVIYTQAGPEIGVASTKAFTSQVLNLLLFSIYLSRSRNEFEEDSRKEIFQELAQLSEKVKNILSQEKLIQDCAQKYHLATSALYLGRHFNYPIALEGALKNKEISYMHAEGYAAGEMKHGPIALIDKTLPVICICTDSCTYEKMISSIKEVEAREGIIITLATQGDTQVENISREVIYIPESVEELTPILNAVALQILAYHFAHFKGLEIDKPRNLAKSVTVE